MSIRMKVIALFIAITNHLENDLRIVHLILKKAKANNIENDLIATQAKLRKANNKLKKEINKYEVI